MDSLKIGQPFIVQSRTSKELLNNLTKDNAPILFEGLHTTNLLNHSLLKNRIKIVRTHNVEWQYYQHLAKANVQLFKKIYFKREAQLLKKYESVLKHAQQIWSISPADTDYYQQLLLDAALEVKYLSAFHANNEISSLEGQGEYALYHGNLSVPENIKAVEMLLTKVVPQTNIKWIVAGLNPSDSLQSLCSQANIQNQVELIPNPTETVLNELLANAHINVLPTFQATGIKLKLLNALHKGRFCLVNSPMVDNTGLESICEIAENPQEFAKKITTLQTVSFTDELREQRKTILNQHFNNQENAKKMVDWLSNLSSV